MPQALVARRGLRSKACVAPGRDDGDEFYRRVADLFGEATARTPPQAYASKRLRLTEGCQYRAVGRASPTALRGGEGNLARSRCGGSSSTSSGSGAAAGSVRFEPRIVLRRRGMTERGGGVDDTRPIDIRELAIDTRCMQKVHLAVAPLRVLLVLLFAFLVLFQVMSLPGQFAHMAEESPELAYLRWPMTTVAVLELLCVQVVIVCTWKLLTMVKDGRIFSERSLAWVDAIVWAIFAAWTLLLGVFLYVGFNADDPGLPLLLMLFLLGGAVLGLLMVVMRALLRQATTLRTDMEAVI
jgi:hypothetical protein